MSDKILYTPNQAIKEAEDQALDACFAVAAERGLNVRVQRVSADEPNTVKLMVQFTPLLLDTFDRVAWRRTYTWGARHWRLPPELIGTHFTYRREEYEFAGASHITVSPGGFFVAVRKVDGWIMRMAESFVRQTVLPAMPNTSPLNGAFSVGLRDKERVFI